jgi:hypothetical protein
MVQLFGLWYFPGQKPGYWVYVGDTVPAGNACTVVNPAPSGSIKPVTGSPTAPHQNDFFQVLHFALWGQAGQVPGGDTNVTRLAKTFAVGASIIDQYDSDDSDLDPGTTKLEEWTHTTKIWYISAGDPKTGAGCAFGMETGDWPSSGDPKTRLQRPQGAPNLGANTVVINHAFSEVGELGFAIDTSNAGLPTLNFYTAYNATTNQDPRVLDFFSYNPVSSGYPRAGIVNLNTRNWPVLAAILQGTITTDALPRATPTATISPNPYPTPTASPSPVVTSSTAQAVAQAIVNATSTQPALTRADVARLVQVAGGSLGSDPLQKEAIARALGEVGEARSWSLFIDVIAQTGKYKPNAPDLTGSNFVVEGEKRFWLHIAIGRDLKSDGTVDVIGTQLEEVVE